MKTQTLVKKVEQAPVETQKLIAQILEASPSFQHSLATVLSTVSEKKPCDTIMDALTATEVLDKLASQDPLAVARLKGIQRKRDLLYQDGSPLTSEEVASLLQITRQAVDKRRKKGQLLGVSLGRRGFRYPLWQFDEGKVLTGLEQVLNQLKDYDPWTQLMFFRTGDIRLGGATPLERLQAGDIDTVVWAASCYGKPIAA